MSKSGTIYRWGRQFSLLALCLGVAVLLPKTAAAQTEQIQAQKEHELAQLRLKLDGLLQEAAGEPVVIAADGDEEGRIEIVQLKANLADAMKARAAAEFSGYVQEVAKENAVAQLRRYEALQVAQPQAGERDKAMAELKRAEAAIQQKMAEVRELEARIRAISQKMQTAEVAAKRAGEASAQRVINRVEMAGDQVEEITLRKVNGKWEIVGPKTVRVVGASKVLQYEAKPVPQPRIGVVREVTMPQAANKVIELRKEAGPIRFTAPQPAPTGSRLDELEKKMDKVMQQLEQIRRDMNRGRSRSDGTPEGAPERVRVLLANEVEAIGR
jgi:hypothetical protein